MPKYTDYTLPSNLDNMVNIDELMEQISPVFHSAQASTYAALGFNINDSMSYMHSPILKRPGATFMTRPNLNLTDENLALDDSGVFQQLLDKSKLSVEAMVRATLDPDLHKLRTGDDAITELIDRENPFITVFYNTLEEMSGFPDEVTAVSTSEAGIMGETRSYIDGIPDIYSSYDTDATVKNINGMLTFWIVYYWSKYIKNVKVLGTMMPYTKNMITNEEDYTTRIYRFVLSSDYKTVEYMYHSGASKILNLSIGKFFNYNREDMYSQEFNDFTLRFSNDGAVYMTPKIIRTFNEHLVQANVGMAKMIEGGDDSLVQKLKPLEYTLFKFGTYPYIHPVTRELEWWVYKDFYEKQKIKITTKGVRK